MENELELFNKLAKKLFEAEKNEPVTVPIPAEELFETLDITLKDEPAEAMAFEKSLEALVLNTPRTATKQFFNQLFGGRNPKATLGDLLAVLLNNSMYTYKVAGPQVGIEKEIIKNICNIIGFPANSDGTFAPGGSMSNFMAMVMARDAYDANIKSNGRSPVLRIYTSEESHYSIPKNAALIGIGRNNVQFIAVDEHGKMIPEKLEKAIHDDISKGFQPFFVNATAGTTVLGAFDPISSISKICKKFDLWLHVDGAYCGSVIFSSKYKHLIDGLEAANSFSVNAHKMMGTPLTCSILVTKNKKQLHESFSNEAAYLYQTDGDDFNLGKTSIQCGRRNDALKFWTLWKSVGTKGLETIVDKQFELAKIARNYVIDHPDYTCYSYPDSISVCFNYKGFSAKELCTTLYKNAELMVGYGTFKEDQFIRLVTINANNSEDDIYKFFKIIEKFASQNSEKVNAIAFKNDTVEVE